MFRTTAAFALLCILLHADPAAAADSAVTTLHGRVLAAETIVVARIAGGNQVLQVDRVLKGSPSKQIALASGDEALRAGSRELLFLVRDGSGYVLLPGQAGRMAAEKSTLASIERLVELQARAATSDADAHAVYLAALADRDAEVQSWAAATVHTRIAAPSPALVKALLARWPKDRGAIANAVVTWRVREAAPVMANTLTTSTDGEERGWAARALGATGDRTYLAMLRYVAAVDTEAWAREQAYTALVNMAGIDALEDLRRGARDASERVRGAVAVAAFNLLELGRPEPRRSPSTALIATVQAFLTQMTRDPVPQVSNNARTMLASIARQRP